MPELPEVETTKASLAPLLDQQVLSVDVRQSSLRWPIPADLNKLVGQRLIQLKRRSNTILPFLNKTRCFCLWACSGGSVFVGLGGRFVNTVILLFVFEVSD